MTPEQRQLKEFLREFTKKGIDDAKRELAASTDSADRARLRKQIAKYERLVEALTKELE
ncbi:MAG TPA: hypothetical protein VE988_09210 [Gemmataceae bacterium]|nr:hypothetical protein [Gemmataceae bacterium]